MVRTPNAKKPWTAEDEEHLRELWGSKGGLPAIARKMGRSVDAVKVRANRLGLGAYLDGGILVTFRTLHKIMFGPTVNGSETYNREKWRELGLEIHKTRVQNNTFYMVDVEEFWKWAKNHKAELDFSRFEENALGKEPQWVKEKRRTDIENRRLLQPKKCRWSNEEESRLRFLLEIGATYVELESELNRSSSAIRRKIYDLNLPAPKRCHQVKWTEGDMHTLVCLIGQGYSQDYCAKKLRRSCQAVRGRVDFLKSRGLWQRYERV